MKPRDLASVISSIEENSDLATLSLVYDLTTINGYVNLLVDAMVRLNGGNRDKYLRAVHQVVIEEVSRANITKAYSILDYTDVESRIRSLVNNYF